MDDVTFVILPNYTPETGFEIALIVSICSYVNMGYFLSNFVE